MNTPISICGEPPFAVTDPLFIEMRSIAFEQAKLAGQYEEVPIGAALFTYSGELLGKGFNSPIRDNDPTAHAEINCLRDACKNLNNYRLPKETIMVVTLEPCIMCLGAIIHARVSGVIYSAFDSKTGSITSNLPGSELPFANHKFWAIGGIEADKSKNILQNFFKSRRKNKP